MLGTADAEYGLSIATLGVAFVAAVAAVVAALIGANARTKTTMLAAQLAGEGEFRRWQREEFLKLTGQLLVAGHTHRRSAEMLLSPLATYSSSAIDCALAQLREVEILTTEVTLLCEPAVEKAVIALLDLHLLAARKYARGPSDIPRASDAETHAIEAAAIMKDVITAEMTFVAAARLQLGLGENLSN
ncbi:MAG TPA: hypothetical protein VEJ84_00655 [Acidimicrobiales bacterium]|nr:hypothetical protein [Acidimicrobiales bacterium]